jgi:hypothetical protein
MTVRSRAALASRLGPVALWFVASAGLLASQACSAARPGSADYEHSVLSAAVAAGPCLDEGATTSCNVETGRDGNIVNCFVGTQTCHDGAWSACGADGAGGATIKAIDISSSLAAAPESAPTTGGLSTLSVSASDWSTTTGGCAQNPCNPNCMGVDVDAGALQPDGGLVSMIVGSTGNLSTFPSPKTVAQSTPSCTVGSPPANNAVCSYDYCCAAATGATTGTCQQWISSGSSTCRTPVGVDYTTGIGCENGSSSVHIPVCNRGTADATTGKLLIAGYPGNPNSAGSAAVCTAPGTSPSEGCLIDLSVKPLKAGKCLDVDVASAAAGNVAGVKCASASDFNSGNRTTMVNPPSPTTLPSSLVAGYGAASYTQLAEIDKCNDQSFVYTQVGSCTTYGAQAPASTTYSFNYTAKCLMGYRAQWNQFSYSTTTPAGSEVIFAATTAPALADGGAGTSTASVVLADVKTAGDPAICSASGSVTGCPKNLGTALGAPAKYNPILQVSVTTTATTATPTVNSWQASYSCVPSE